MLARRKVVIIEYDNEGNDNQNLNKKGEMIMNELKQAVVKGIIWMEKEARIEFLTDPYIGPCGIGLSMVEDSEKLIRTLMDLFYIKEENYEKLKEKQIVMLEKMKFVNIFYQEEGIEEIDVCEKGSSVIAGVWNIKDPYEIFTWEEYREEERRSERKAFLATSEMIKNNLTEVELLVDTFQNAKRASEDGALVVEQVAIIILEMLTQISMKQQMLEIYFDIKVGDRLIDLKKSIIRLHSMCRNAKPDLFSELKNKYRDIELFEEIQLLWYRIEELMWYQIECMDLWLNKN